MLPIVLGSQSKVLSIYRNVLIHILIIYSPLVTYLRKSMRNGLITIGWAIAFSTIALQSRYQRAIQLLTLGTRPQYAAWLKPEHYLLIFVVSVLAGAVLVEPGQIVLSYAGTLSVSILLMFGCLSLPALLGIIGSPGGRISAGLLVESAIIDTFQSIVLGSFIIILMGGLFGGMIGERLE